MQLTKEQKAYLAATLRAPRTLTLAWWPVHVFAAAVDGYIEAFFAALTPRGPQ